MEPQPFEQDEDLSPIERVQRETELNNERTGAMKVKDLIEKLQKVDPERQVWMQISEECKAPANGVEEIRLDEDSGTPYELGTDCVVIWPNAF